MKWKVIMLPIAEKQLAEIKDRRIRESVGKRINDLEYEPELQGKPLIEELGGYRSVRAASQRYRIIYRVEDERVTVLVVALGIRKQGDKKDVYELAKKLLRSDLLDLE